MTQRAPAELTDDLRRLGVRPGDMLMVHASLRKIGPVEGGARGVVEALDAAVGPEGTLVMILGAVVPHEWVNTRPEEERAALLAAEVPYDPQRAPALPEIGVLAEVFRTTPGTRVDANPSGRFGARGRRAAELLEGTPWDDYYGPGSTLHRLCAAGGRVLRLGADPDTTTVLHYAEYLAELPEKRRVRRHYRVDGPSGPETRVVASLDDEHGIVDWPREPDAPETDYFALALGAYLAQADVARGAVGGAPAELLDAADLVRFGARWMTEHLRR